MKKYLNYKYHTTSWYPGDFRAEWYDGDFKVYRYARTRTPSLLTTMGASEFETDSDRQIELKTREFFFKPEQSPSDHMVFTETSPCSGVFQCGDIAYYKWSRKLVVHDLYHVEINKALQFDVNENLKTLLNYTYTNKPTCELVYCDQPGEYKPWHSYIPIMFTYALFAYLFISLVLI